MHIAGSKSPVTLHDVAREAGVSLATASRSLNGSTRTVNQELQERVVKTAARLGYTPNLSAQAVAKGTTMTVALLVADIADPYFSQLAAGIIRAADEAGLIVTMEGTEGNGVRELELVRAMRGQRPKVMILAGSRSSGDPSSEALAEELRAFEATGGRVVFISENALPFDTVLIDNYEGARELAGAMVNLGYRRFAAVAGPSQLVTSCDRLSGFRDGLAEHGLDVPEARIRHAAFTRDGGYHSARALLADEREDIDLIFAVNDVMAVGAMTALRDEGILPGRDVAVAGYDDIPLVRDVTPALTTVRIPLELVGRQALARALQAGGTDAGAPVATEVILRASTPQR
ncbi:MAG: LacI family DNA-binding transcriptional regulator [Homoserinimonas sp.]